MVGRRSVIEWVLLQVESVGGCTEVGFLGFLAMPLPSGSSAPSSGLEFVKSCIRICIWFMVGWHGVRVRGTERGVTIGEGRKRRGGSGVCRPRETEFTGVRKFKDLRILEGNLATSTSDCCWQTYGGKSWGGRHGRVTQKRNSGYWTDTDGIETARGGTPEMVRSLYRAKLKDPPVGEGRYRPCPW
jgi:hypothetical protein